MRFHLGSFLLGAASGAALVALLPRLRPLLVEAGTVLSRISRAISARVARGRENLEDLVAEARARARDVTVGQPNGHDRAAAAAEPRTPPAAGG